MRLFICLKSDWQRHGAFMIYIIQDRKLKAKHRRNSKCKGNITEPIRMNPTPAESAIKHDEGRSSESEEAKMREIRARFVSAAYRPRMSDQPAT